MKTFHSTFRNQKNTFSSKKLLITTALAALLIAGCANNNPPADDTSVDDTTTATTQSQQQTPTVSMAPSEGWTLHMTAKKLFPGNPDMTVNKYCKSVADMMSSMMQCELFDGNDSDSRLVGVETMVGQQMFNTFTPDEKKLWMPTKDLMLATTTTMPDIDAQQFKNVTESLSGNYSKIYLLWDPGKLNLPTGSPVVSVMNTAVATGTVLNSNTPANLSTAAGVGASNASGSNSNPASPAASSATSPSASGAISNTASGQASPGSTSSTAPSGFTFGAFDINKILAAGLTDKKGNFEDSVLQRNATASLELYKLKNNIGLHTYTNTTQIIFIVSGKGEFTIGDKKQQVTSGMVVIIPAGTSQAFQNLNDKTTPLIFVTLKTPYDDANVKWQ